MPRTSMIPAALLVLTALGGCRPPAAALEVQALLERRDYAAAQARVLNALARDPGSQALWRLRLRVHLARGLRGQAVDAYREHARSRGEDTSLLQELALGVLEESLESRTPEVRLVALHAARDTDAPELESAMTDRLNDPDPLVRTWAAVALSQTRQGVEVLEQQLAAPQPRARAVAVRELGRIAGHAALTSFARFARDSDAGVRAAAAAALGGLRKKKAEALAAVLTLLGDADASVRSEAVSSAARLGDKGAAVRLRQLISDPHLGVRLAVVVALADLQDGEAAAGLREIAGGDDVPAALRASLRLAKLGEVQPALNAIAKGLVDRRWPVRAAACNAASSLKDTVAPQLLEKALRDPEPRVRLTAARAVLAHGQREQAIRVATSIKQLACPGKPDAQRAELCERAAEILALSGEGDGVPTLSGLVSRAPTAETRLSALRLALGIGRDRGLALTAIADTDPTVAIAAAAWLYKRTK